MVTETVECCNGCYIIRFVCDAIAASCYFDASQLTFTNDKIDGHGKCLYI